MPEGISNYVAPVNYPSNPWIDRGNYFLCESTVSDIICLSFESKSFRYQIGYEVSPELSKVEDYVPGTRGRELAKTLESDELVSYEWSSGGELVGNLIWQWVPDEGTDISSRRIQLSATLEKDTEEWPFTLELEDIANDVCVEFCNLRGLIPVLEKCLRQIEKIFADRKSLYAELDYFEDDFSAEDGHVAIRLEVAYDAQTSSAKYNAWINWAIDNIKPNDIGLFTLTIRRL